MRRDDDFTYGHMNSGLGWFMALVLAGLLIAAIAALIIYSLNLAKVPPSMAGPPVEEGSARRILDERLARGEIAPDEYRERRQALDT